LIKLIRTRACEYKDAVSKAERSAKDLKLLRGAKALAEEITKHYVPRGDYEQTIEKLELSSDLARKLEEDWDRHMQQIRKLEEENCIIRMALAAKVLEKEKEAGHDVDVCDDSGA
jgi:hypothetical protein